MILPHNPLFDGDPRSTITPAHQRSTLNEVWIARGTPPFIFCVSFTSSGPPAKAGKRIFSLDPRRLALYQRDNNLDQPNALTRIRPEESSTAGPRQI